MKIDSLDQGEVRWGCLLFSERITERGEQGAEGVFPHPARDRGGLSLFSRG